MSKSARTNNRLEDAVAWVIFSLCSVSAFVGLATDHKEVIGVAFAALGFFLVSYIALTVVQGHRMTARMRKTNERTAADMI